MLSFVGRVFRSLYRLLYLLKSISFGLRIWVVSLSISIAALAGCTPSTAPSDQALDRSEPVKVETPTLTRHQNRVIYGEDSRLDYYELEADSVIRRRVMHSSGVLVRPQALSVQGERVITNVGTLGAVKNLCEGERFHAQPKIGYCSGTLIDDDLVLTAGHCVDDANDCANTRLLFRSLYLSSDELVDLSIRDLYECQEVVTRLNNGGGDYAIFRLDRPVEGNLEPAPVKEGDALLSSGTQLALVGGPNGIPIKTDLEGTVTRPGDPSTRIFFGLSVDAFGGNSGSALYNALGEIEGILVQGRTDYSFDQTDQCFRVNQIEVDETGHSVDGRGEETGVYVSRAIEALCAQTSDTPLCEGELGGQGGTMGQGGAEGGGMSGGGEVPPLDCVDAQEEDDQVSQAHPIAEGQFVSYTFCDDAIDWVTVSLDADEAIDVESYYMLNRSDSTSADTVISIETADGEVLTGDDDGGSRLMSWVQNWRAPNAGEYLIRVKNYNQTFGPARGYQLMVRSACQEDQFEAADDLDLPLLNNGNRRVTHDDGLNGHATLQIPARQTLSLCDEDWRHMVVTEEIAARDESMVIETQTIAGVDTLLSLIDESGEVVIENDDRAPNDRSSLIEWTPVVGDYWVRVKSFNDLYGGDRPYTLLAYFEERCDSIDNDADGLIDEGLTDCLTCEPDLYEENDSSTASVFIGKNVPIEVNHCLDSSDWYRVNFTAGTRFDVETYVNQRSDTRVAVYGPQGQYIGYNDDRAERELGSLITQIEAGVSGTYYIFVGQYQDNFGPDRPYKLLVRDGCIDDEWEHDDSALEAPLIAFESTNTQPIRTLTRAHDLCDPDWVKFESTRGERYLIEVTDLENLAVTLTVSRDFGRASLAVAQSSDLVDQNGGDISLIWEAPSDETYWIQVGSESGQYGGVSGYTLNITPFEIESCDQVDNDQDDLVDEGLLNACGTCGPPPEERCDGEDNDCDLRVDEGTLNACGQCGALPEEECDSVDNDCDGFTDEGLLNACGLCGPTPREVCNDRDDDCDGQIDEATLNACRSCGPLPIEVCDSMDNDCDGQIDESLLNACGTCGSAPQEECDEADNDCDGQVDEGCVIQIAGAEVGGVGAGVAGAGSEVEGGDGSAGASGSEGGSEGGSSGGSEGGSVGGEAVGGETAGAVVAVEAGSQSDLEGGALSEGGSVGLAQGGEESIALHSDPLGGEEEDRDALSPLIGCQTTTGARGGVPSWVILILLLIGTRTRKSPITESTQYID